MKMYFSKTAQRNFFVLLLSTGITLLSSCTEQNEAKKVFEEFEGPMIEATKVEMIFSDSAMIKVKAKAPLQLEYQSGDMDFPEGLYIEFFNDKKEKYAYIKANNAYYFKTEDRWRAREDVVVENLESNERLNTEELFWEPNKEWISTEKFVTITTATEILHGTGFEAKQDLSDATIIKPTGVFDLDEEESADSTTSKVPENQKK